MSPSMVLIDGEEILGMREFPYAIIWGNLGLINVLHFSDAERVAVFFSETLCYFSGLMCLGTVFSGKNVE